MPFITQGKTNLRYILIVVVLAIIIGGGILVWANRDEIHGEPALIHLPGSLQTPTTMSEEDIQEIAEKVFPEGYEVNDLSSIVEDLDGNGDYEVVMAGLGKMCGQEPSCDECRYLQYDVYFAVVTAVDENMDYQGVLISNFGCFSVGPVFGMKGGAGEIEYHGVADVDEDGIKEIVVAKGAGANSSHFGILDIDWKTGEISWLRVLGKDGVENPISLCSGASVRHSCFYEIEDQDNNGIVEILDWECNDYEVVGDQKCSADIYEWNGEIIAYKGKRTE